MPPKKIVMGWAPFDPNFALGLADAARKKFRLDARRRTQGDPDAFFRRRSELRDRGLIPFRFNGTKRTAGSMEVTLEALGFCKGKMRQFGPEST